MEITIDNSYNTISNNIKTFCLKFYYCFTNYPDETLKKNYYFEISNL